MSDVLKAGGEGAGRVERDSMGEVWVPGAARWGPQTQRAVENFPISGLRLGRSIIAALATIKGVAASVNASLGVIDQGVANALRHAAAEVADGRWDEHFPVDVFQTGSGTSSNMNMNEVLANLASERLGRAILPNEEPNASQSSNDAFPSAIHLAVTHQIVTELIPALAHLGEVLEAKALATAHVVKAGRTHLMDATPVTLGQEMGGYAAAVRLGVERLRACLPRVAELPLGGTAVGTGLNAPPEFAPRTISRLAEDLGLPLTEARNHFEAQGGRDALVEASGTARTIAISLYKMANDLRWMASGPRCGLGEIRLPPMQPGSSMMPGKVNPVVPEAVCQVVAQVVGNDAAVAFGAAAGTLELNVMMPVMAHNLLESIALLSTVVRALADRCVAGLEANEEQCRSYALSSPSLVTALGPHIGYEAASRVVASSLAQGRDLRTVVVDLGLLSQAQADTILDVEAMTRGGML